MVQTPKTPRGNLACGDPEDPRSYYGADPIEHAATIIATEHAITSITTDLATTSTATEHVRTATTDSEPEALLPRPPQLDYAQPLAKNTSNRY